MIRCCCVALGCEAQAIYCEDNSGSFYCIDHWTKADYRHSLYELVPVKQIRKDEDDCGQMYSDLRELAKEYLPEGQGPQEQFGKWNKFLGFLKDKSRRTTARAMAGQPATEDPGGNIQVTVGKAMPLE